jgi:hypothetical protein
VPLAAKGPRHWSEKAISTRGTAGCHWSPQHPTRAPPPTCTRARPPRQLNGTAYITFAHPDERGVPIGDYVNTYATRQELYDAICTGTYRESGAGGVRCGAAGDRVAAAIGLGLGCGWPVITGDRPCAAAERCRRTISCYCCNRSWPPSNCARTSTMPAAAACFGLTATPS